MATKNPLQFQLINVLAYLSRKNNKNYCFPSQVKICELLDRVHGIKISVRTLNRYLLIIEGAGSIERTRRIKTLSSGELSFQTTLYTIKKAAYKYLARCMYLLKECGIRLREKVKILGYQGGGGVPRPSYPTKEEAKEFLSLALEKCNV